MLCFKVLLKKIDQEIANFMPLFKIALRQRDREIATKLANKNKVTVIIKSYKKSESHLI